MPHVTPLLGPSDLVLHHLDLYACLEKGFNALLHPCPGPFLALAMVNLPQNRKPATVSLSRYFPWSSQHKSNASLYIGSNLQQMGIVCLILPWVVAKDGVEGNVIFMDLKDFGILLMVFSLMDWPKVIGEEVTILWCRVSVTPPSCCSIIVYALLNKLCEALWSMGLPSESSLAQRGLGGEEGLQEYTQTSVMFHNIRKKQLDWFWKSFKSLNLSRNFFTSLNRKSIFNIRVVIK